MPESYPFPIYSGVLEPKHYKQIGSALWLFLWCVSSTTSDKTDGEGVTWGIVLGNKPVKIDDLAVQFGVFRSTIKRWIEALETHGYIRVTRAPYGLIFTVKNSKKFASKNGPSEGDRPNMVHPDRPESVHQGSENGPSNKDITEIFASSAAIADQNEIFKRALEVEKHFLAKRGKGTNLSPIDFAEVKKMVADGLPVDLIKASIDRSFADYRPKHSQDEIRNMRYCIPRCYDEWAKMQTATPITDPVPSGSVALGTAAPRGGRSRAQEQLDDLDKIIEEGKKRAGVGSGQAFQGH